MQGVHPWRRAWWSSYQLRVSYFEEYIEENQTGKLYKVYSDGGVTGTEYNASGFNQMIKDAKEGKFDYIITKSIQPIAETP